MDGITTIPSILTFTFTQAAASTGV
jgi:hypothetical protein